VRAKAARAFGTSQSRFVRIVVPSSEKALQSDPNASADANFAGYDSWVNKLNQFNGNFIHADMVKGFINSGEYRGRFGPCLSPASRFV